jgi:hypothetical protein
MRKLYDENHNVVEVPDEAEITALQEKAGKVDTMQAELDELNGDDKVINFKKTREIIGNLTEALKKAGKSVDAEGNVTEAPGALSIEQIREESTRAARNEILNNHLASKLAGIKDENERKAVEEYYNRLSGGDVADIATVDKNFADAIKVVSTGDSNQGTVVLDGAPPKNAADVTLSPAAQELEKMLETNLPPAPKE